MSKTYIVYGTYRPSSAPTNRLMAFVRGFSELGVNADVLFLMPDIQSSKVEQQYQNITFHYLWEGFKPKGKYTKYLTGFWGAMKIRHLLKAGDKVLMLCPYYLDIIVGVNKVEYYHERTEHPSVVKNYTMPFDASLKRYKNIMSKSSGVFVISTALKQYFLNIGLPENRVHIVNMIVDSKRFEGLNKDENVEKYIAYCGTASNNKDGVNLLIQSFAIVAKSHPDYKLYIVGNAPSKKDASGNIELVQQLSLQDKVIFTGVIKAQDIPQLLKNAAIVALNRPDSLQACNGFPTKLGEYLLSETPVVVTKVGDIPKFLEDGQTALIAEERNNENFAAKLNWAIENPNIAMEIGRRGAFVARESFNYLTESKKIKDIMGL